MTTTAPAQRLLPWHPPLGNHVLHSCDRRECVNPLHLSWGTPSKNLTEAYARGRRKVAA